jgi:hypothetical protein
LLLDGCQVTKLANHETCPVILTILNLPPEIRYNNENILLSLLIPGPRKYKDLNTFLFPLVEELHILADGVADVKNDFTGESFDLRAHLILVSADGPASADAMGLKRPGNAIRPCHHCMIPGVNGADKEGKSHYYVPHKDIQDLANLPPRTQLRDLIDHFDALPSGGEKTGLGQYTGIVKRSILQDINTLSFPESFPPDLMHCVLQNIMPKIFNLFGGTKKAERSAAKVADEEYRKRAEREWGVEAVAEKAATATAKYLATDLPSTLPDRVWDEVGKTQDESRRTIPTLLGQGPRPINTRWKGYKAMEWEAFLIRDGLSLLSHLDLQYEQNLLNFQVLRSIYVAATSKRLSKADITRLRSDCIAFVRKFEELYYKCPSQLNNCLLNVHSLLHLGM